MAGSAGGVRAGKAFVELGVKDQLSAGLNAASKRLKAFGAGLATAGAGLLGAGASIGAGLGAAVGVFASFGDELSKMSQRTGISVESLSELRHAAEMSAVSTEQLEVGIKGMQKQITDASNGTGEAVSAFAALGVNMDKLKAMTPEQQFTALADKISQVQDPTQKAALAMRIFGESGQKLLPMLNGGAGGIQALRDEAKALGLTVSTDAANSAVKLGDDLANLSKSLKAAAFAVGAALAPTLINIVGIVQRVATSVVFFVQQNKGLVMAVAGVATGLVAAGAALITLGGLFTAAGAALGALVTIGGAVMSVIGAIGAVFAFAFSPIGLLIAGVVAAGAALVHFSGIGGQAVDFLGGAFAGLKETFGTTWQGITDALAAGDLALAAQVAWAGVKVAFLEGVAPLLDIWTEFKTSMLAGWNATVAGIENTWIAFQSTFLTAWNSSVAVLKNTWAEILGWFEKGMVVVQEFLGLKSEAQASAEFQAIDAKTRGTQAGNSAAAASANRGINADAAGRQLGNTVSAALATGQDVLAGRDELEQRKKELAAAKEALASTAKQAAQEKALATANKIQGPPGEFDLSKIAPALTQPPKGLATSSAGTFNAAAAGQIGRAGDVNKQILDVAQEQKDLLEEIASNTSEGLSFA